MCKVLRYVMLCVSVSICASARIWKGQEEADEASKDSGRTDVDPEDVDLVATLWLLCDDLQHWWLHPSHDDIISQQTATSVELLLLVFARSTKINTCLRIFKEAFICKRIYTNVYMHSRIITQYMWLKNDDISTCVKFLKRWHFNTC